MSDIAIRVDNLSKKYILSHQSRERYMALRDVMAGAAKNLAKKLVSPFISNHPTLSASREEFYALKDVSFEIKQGDRVGIIGRNGAGKSTLLKVLSRITEPTSGRIEITGRVASLLEVGTGFHPELTGRENIFLNGAILGMGKAEIKRKFDEIVDFAEVERFLDTPVKRYSSGMYVRLAFAVAAHLEPEILIVDEVLAVGDAQFQKKCLGKMEDIGKEGRTVLFVSHNMAAVGALCRRGFVLHGGKVICSGEVAKCLQFYQSDLQTQNMTPLAHRIDRKGSGIARFVNVSVISADGQSTTTIHSGDKLEVVFEVESKQGIDRVLPGLNLSNSVGERVSTFWAGFTDKTITLKPGLNRLLLRVGRLDLRPGEYRLSATLGLNGEALDDVEDVWEISVVAPSEWTPARYPSLGHGTLFAEFQWIQV